MQKKFIENLVKNCKCDLKAKFLLCVSGGEDSAVMTNLFYISKLNFGIAHCNFKLRNNSSDKDALFVKEMAYNYNVHFFTKAFDTKKYATSHKISIEMAARKLRYNWFEEIRKTNNFDYIVTAHHANDVAETVLINLIRGTGIRGLTGIPVRNRNIVRPLLNFSKNEISEFSKTNNIKFRDDESNYNTQIFRNKIRHEVIPVLEELNPVVVQTILNNSLRFTEINSIYQSAVKKFEKKYLQKQGDIYSIPFKKIKNKKGLHSYLFEILKKFGFANKEVDSLIDSFDSISGKSFYSKTHYLLKDRKYLYIKPLKNTDKKYFLIEKGNEIYMKPIYLKLKYFDYTSNFNIDKRKNNVCLDFDKLVFPLILRKWEKGDYFFPLGMRGKKKISDFFTDNKYSLIDKENSWLLESDGKIVWIIGERMDNRFKLTSNTKKVCEISTLKDE